jgi:glycogen debranching enzyme
MIFLDDDMNTHYTKIRKGEKKTMKMCDIIQNIIESHARGIEFREWRAGKEIDEHMRDEGFNVKIYLDRNNGLIYGGNPYNCGTWMDKMGSSDKAKNKGIPATPRDGADVEIIGLLYSILTFLISIYPNHYPYKTVKLKDNSNLSLLNWSLLIKDNFENLFFISKRKSTDNFYYQDKIYKDVVFNGNRPSDYQLRPNFLIAMSVAPELFSMDKAYKALERVEKYLLVKNGLGMQTLDSNDLNYNGNYNNADDSCNYNTAHGFNYHNVNK